jgi:hypothetical protein
MLDRIKSSALSFRESADKTTDIPTEGSPQEAGGAHTEGLAQDANTEENNTEWGAQEQPKRRSGGFCQMNRRKY